MRSALPLPANGESKWNQKLATVVKPILYAGKPASVTNLQGRLKVPVHTNTYGKIGV